MQKHLSPPPPLSAPWPPKRGRPKKQSTVTPSEPTVTIEPQQVSGMSPDVLQRFQNYFNSRNPLSERSGAGKFTEGVGTVLNTIRPQNWTENWRSKVAPATTATQTLDEISKILADKDYKSEVLQPNVDGTYNSGLALSMGPDLSSTLLNISKEHGVMTGLKKGSPVTIEIPTSTVPELNFLSLHNSKAKTQIRLTMDAAGKIKADLITDVKTKLKGFDKNNVVIKDEFIIDPKAKQIIDFKTGMPLEMIQKSYYSGNQLNFWNSANKTADQVSGYPQVISTDPLKTKPATGWNKFYNLGVKPLALGPLAAFGYPGFKQRSQFSPNASKVTVDFLGRQREIGPQSPGGMTFGDQPIGTQFADYNLQRDRNFKTGRNFMTGAGILGAGAGLSYLYYDRDTKDFLQDNSEGAPLQNINVNDPTKKPGFGFSFNPNWGKTRPSVDFENNWGRDSMYINNDDTIHNKIWGELAPNYKHGGELLKAARGLPVKTSNRLEKQTEFIGDRNYHLGTHQPKARNQFEIDLLNDPDYIKFHENAVNDFFGYKNDIELQELKRAESAAGEYPVSLPYLNNIYTYGIPNAAKDAKLFKSTTDPIFELDDLLHNVKPPKKDGGSAKTKFIKRMLSTYAPGGEAAQDTSLGRGNRMDSNNIVGSKIPNFVGKMSEQSNKEASSELYKMVQKSGDPKLMSIFMGNGEDESNEDMGQQDMMQQNPMEEGGYVNMDMANPLTRFIYGGDDEAPDYYEPYDLPEAKNGMVMSKESPLDPYNWFLDQTSPDNWPGAYPGNEPGDKELSYTLDATGNKIYDPAEEAAYDKWSEDYFSDDAKAGSQRYQDYQNYLSFYNSVGEDDELDPKIISPNTGVITSKGTNCGPGTVWSPTYNQCIPVASVRYNERMVRRAPGLLNALGLWGNGRSPYERILQANYLGSNMPYRGNLNSLGKPVATFKKNWLAPKLRIYDPNGNYGKEELDQIISSYYGGKGGPKSKKEKSNTKSEKEESKKDKSEKGPSEVKFSSAAMKYRVNRVVKPHVDFYKNIGKKVIKAVTKKK